MGDYLVTVGYAISCLANALLGGPINQSLSARIGLSILRNGWNSRIRFPERLRDHFISAAIRYLAE